MNRTRFGLAPAALLILAVGLLVATPSADITNSQQTVKIYNGGGVRVESNQNAIRRVVIQGNLTAAIISNETIPARSFSLSCNTTQFYTINLLLSLPGSYTATITLEDPSENNSTQLPSTYVSGGDLNLTIFASFEPRPTSQSGPVGWDSFSAWMTQFSGAFPWWVKLLYVLIGVQFGLIGYRWIKFEDERRRIEKHLPPLDRGNKAYLWTDIIFRALLTGFVLCIIVMIGEAVIILIAENLFFITLSFVSLLDFFSLFFVAIIALLVYIGREAMDRFLDFKPLMED